MKILKLALFILSLFYLANIQSCKKAETVIDPCENVSCENGGTCIDGTCDCPDGFSGTSCEIEDLCFEVNCENGGECVEGICDCPDGFIGSNCELFDPTQVQAFLDEGISPIVLYNGGITLENLYCKLYKGGLIFFVDVNNSVNGIDGLVAAMEDQGSEVEWGCNFEEIPGLNDIPIWELNPETKDGALIGDGAPNTSAILNAPCTSGSDVIAAKLCRDLGEDWFLPSLSEMVLMHSNLKNCVDFDFFSFYWSSTSMSDSNVWVVDFFQGQPNASGRSQSLSVRAAKAF